MTAAFFRQMNRCVRHDRAAAIHLRYNDSRELNEIGFWIFLRLGEGTTCKEKYAERENLFHTVMTSIGLVFVKNDTDMVLPIRKVRQRNVVSGQFGPLLPVGLTEL